MVKKRDIAEARERLSRDAIVTGAIALADAEGLGAVTIRRLAQSHGVTPMALYWHFKDKDQLLDGIAERLFQEVQFPPVDSAPWDEQLRAVLMALVAALRPHPSVAWLARDRIFSCEPGLAIAERTLSLLRQAGFTADRSADIGGFLLTAVVTLVSVEPGSAYGTDAESRDDALRVKTAALSALSPRRYPSVVASAGALAACTGPDSNHELGIGMMVTGIVCMADGRVSSR
ncbi:TetR/AcrR family transcriptional regulator [Streptomyces sp. NPDC059909]|uniref:TetR/AcrR family transcriptional regulator n=1 Tax=Streptomyces sp. NPDC059909 TaxID=3346998 RepID=UPI00364DC669